MSFSLVIVILIVISITSNITINVTINILIAIVVLSLLCVIGPSTPIISVQSLEVIVF